MTDATINRDMEIIRAQAVVEKWYGDAVRTLADVLWSGITTLDRDEAIRRFRTGLALAKETKQLLLSELTE